MVVANVYIADRWGNGISGDDVTAGEATAGDVSVETWVITSNSNATISQLKVWIAVGVSGVEISDDNITFVTPIIESDALSFGDIAVDGSVNLYVKRTVVAGATSNPSIFNILEFVFTSI